MTDIVTTLKRQARNLHKSAAAGDVGAWDRLRKLPDVADALPASLKRRHCLTLVAREYGFNGWSHLTAILGGASDGDFGTLLVGPGCTAHWNIWSASYEEARTIRAEHGGYLLTYRHHFMIVDRHYIETLGLDPDDDDWGRLGRDWARPRDSQARKRLYAKLMEIRSAGRS
jgi:hypothetical protein